MALFLIAWWLVGFSAGLVYLSRALGELTVGDVCVCAFAGGTAGPIMLFMFVPKALSEKVLWRRR